MSYKQLNIKNPCNQQWEEMVKVSNGRHCNKCNHTIIDFSEMSNAELVAMLQSGKYSCGRFDKEQMGTIYYVDEQKKKRKKYWNAIAAAIVAGVLQVSVSYSQTPDNRPIIKQSSLKLKGNPTVPNNQHDEKTVIQSEKLSFRVVDSETKQPLPYVHIELMGQHGMTDSLGRIDFEIQYNENNQGNFYAHLIVGKYEELKVKLDLKSCLIKLNVLYMRKKQKEEKSMIVGQW